MNQPVVSIIVPCFNGEHVMFRLLDSILAQSYKYIEFILINDGSTDNSEKVWRSYEPAFDKAGITYKYIYQENQGLGAAINAGLKIFTGDYLCWPDIDDYLDPTSIEKRVNYLEKHPEFGSVSSDANCYNEDDLLHPVDTAARHLIHINEEWQFRYLLQGQSLYCSGCHMLRASHFLDVNPERRIYPARRGQNNQMLLPIYYKYKHGFIAEPLYNYIIYSKSMSTPDKSFESALNREQEYMDLLRATLSDIEMDDENIAFCEGQLIRTEWDLFSSVFIKFKKPLLFIRKYLNLKIYKTEQKKEIKGVVYAIIGKRS